MKLDGWRCYGAMTALEQRRWRNALYAEAERTGMDKKVFYKLTLDAHWETFERFIVNSFIWSHTKEGSDYWIWVANKYILHDLLTPRPGFRLTPPKIF